MYTRIESRFWPDEKMKPKSGDAKLLMLYFLTSPHRNLIGFYYLPVPYICFDLGWSEKRLQQPFGELLGDCRVWYDHDAHVILIPNYLKHNPLENPNQVKSATEKLDELPDTPLLFEFEKALQKYGKPSYEPLFKRLQERLAKGFETLSKQGTGTGTGTETGTGIDTINAPDGAGVSVVPAENCDERGAQRIPSGRGSVIASAENRSSRGARQKPAGKDDEYTEKFLEWWAAYPRRIEKRSAYECWKARLKEGVDPETLILAARNYAKVCRREETPARYIKHPTTFLGPAHRTKEVNPWEDYVEPLPEVQETDDRERLKSLLKEGMTGERS